MHVIEQRAYAIHVCPDEKTESTKARANTTGRSNLFFGASSGVFNTRGNSNSFFDRSTGQNNTKSIIC